MISAEEKLNLGFIGRLSLPFILAFVFIAINLTIGFLSFRDYGVSWDEPGIYSFAHESVQAYQNFLKPVEYSDPNANFDLRYYGPFYFVFVDLVTEAIKTIGFQFLAQNVWHLSYFFTYQAGLVIFYFFSRRWLNDWAALGALVLMSSQPLLWGHAFINPKDIPFMVFFLTSVFAGFQMVDHLKTISGCSLPSPFGFSGFYSLTRGSWAGLSGRQKTRAKQQLGLAAGIILLLTAITAWLNKCLPDMVRLALQSKNFLINRIFSTAGNRVPFENYIDKAMIWFSRLELVVLIFLIFLAIWFFFKQIPGASQSLNNSLKGVLQPVLSVLSDPYLICAGIFLGLATSIRLLGGLAGVLVSLFLIYRLRLRAWSGLLIYGGIALLAMYLTWPFLWRHPVQHFLDSLTMMSSFPIKMDVLFNGQYFPADHLPWSYLPVLSAIPVLDFSNGGRSLGYTFDKSLMCTGCCMPRLSVNAR